MSIEVFNRYENKYMIDSKLFYELQNKILEHMELDDYNKNDQKYSIYNIYYDTEDSHLISTSLQKPKYKEKIRMRSYVAPKPEELVYIEIKKKFNGLVNKRRTAMKLEDCYKFLQTGVPPKIEDYMNKQVVNEMAYILERYKLIPKLYLSYDRIAYFDKNDRDLRISFDTNILIRRKDLALEKGAYGEKLLEDNQILMEVKTRKAIPIWLAKLVSQYKMYPISFSKYGAEYQQLLSKNIYRGELCSTVKYDKNILWGGNEYVAVNF